MNDHPQVHVRTLRLELGMERPAPLVSKQIANLIAINTHRYLALLDSIHLDDESVVELHRKMSF